MLTRNKGTKTKAFSNCHNASKNANSCIPRRRISWQGGTNELLRCTNVLETHFTEKLVCTNVWQARGATKQWVLVTWFHVISLGVIWWSLMSHGYNLLNTIYFPSLPLPYTGHLWNLQCHTSGKKVLE